jgi:hypothetical protein
VTLHARIALDVSDRRVGKQSKSARRCRAKTQAGHLRESQAWLERHGIKRKMPATRFAAPMFEFAEPTSLESA